MIFFENERAWGCEHRGRKFAITYTYTWFDIFWRIFRDFLGIFQKILILGNFWDFWKKGPRDPQGSTFWERSGSKIGKNGVKIGIYGTNYHFYLNFRTFDPLLGSPRGRSEFHIFQNVKNFQKSGFCKIHKNGISKMWFFSKMNVPEGVNREAENLLSRIPIRDSTFCDEFL